MASLGLSGAKVLKAIAGQGGFVLQRLGKDYKLTGDSEPLIVNRTVRDLVKQGLLIERKVGTPELTNAGKSALEALE